MVAAAVKPVKPLPGTKYGPTIAVVIFITAIATFARWQLKADSRNIDRMFAQYQSAQSEESRRKVFGEMGRADPRRSVFNVLSWGKDIK